MKIIIACGAMPFGPDTPSRASLGGSETAALMLAKSLVVRGHDVTMFCNLPDKDRPDFFPSGEQHPDGVRYVSIAHLNNFATTNGHDVYIAVRDPALASIPALARKKVLWMHDIATKRGMQRAFDQMSFTINEVWTVSEWHRHQVAETTGYPLERIFALRNGIVEYKDLPALPREEKVILYAARPERGLDNLIRPGGIMDHLPEYKLLVAMYEHFPEHMRSYYEMIFARMRAMPNVDFIGGKPNAELRVIMGMAAAYIYPTQFEETSCILAREAIEQRTPFITTSVGALPESLGDCGIYFEEWLHYRGIAEPERGGDGWCMLFAQFFREAMQNKQGLDSIVVAMGNRDDLYWDGVAAMVEPRLAPPEATDYSRIWSLIRDGDAIPALHYASRMYGTTIYEHCRLPLAQLLTELKDCYAFVNGDLAAYYEETYRSKTGTDSELVFHTEAGYPNPRWEAIAEQIAKLPPGSKVFEYGCGAGHVIGPLAKRFPNIGFVGYDFSPAAVLVINEGANAQGLLNLAATHTAPDPVIDDFSGYDAVICSEVLEHVVEPWKLLDTVEHLAKPGGRVILTVPFGEWEPITFEKPGKWKERFHLWQIDRTMIKEMIGSRANEQAMLVVAGHAPDTRPVGNLIFSFDAAHAGTHPVDPLAKALRHNARQTCAAAVIAMNNEDTIIRMLNSLAGQVQFVQIALGPCTDKTRSLVEDWFRDHPYIGLNIIDAPKIEPFKFGFDDARNMSTQGLEHDFEWVVWIDTDEYLSGNYRKYLRDSALDGYLIAQHHFTCQPRGNPPEIDRPARLFRADRGFQSRGHIHEHFEIPEGGPGRCFMLPDVDIGHTGYVNEDVRRGRFQRNLPFLVWDHEDHPERKLHPFLWFRDLVHSVRFENEPQARAKKAQQAISYYNDHQADMATFGPGIFMALSYLAELYTILGVGIAARISIQLDDRNTQFEGRFESYEQLEGVFAQILKDEFKDRLSRYY